MTVGTLVFDGWFALFGTKTRV